MFVIKSWKELAEKHRSAYSTNDRLTLMFLENKAAELSKSEWAQASEEERKTLSAIEKAARLGLRHEFGKLVNQYAQKSDERTKQGAVVQNTESGVKGVAIKSIEPESILVDDLYNEVEWPLNKTRLVHAAKTKVDEVESKFKRCPKCGQIIKEEAHACKAEGDCPKCGNPDMNIDFGCEKCGYTVGGDVADRLGGTKEEEKVSPKARDWISDKISKLVREGKPQDQAIAIAHSMARQQGMKVPEKKEEKDLYERMDELSAQNIGFSQLLSTLAQEYNTTEDDIERIINERYGPERGEEQKEQDPYDRAPTPPINPIGKAGAKPEKPLKPGLPVSRADESGHTGDDYQSKPIDEIVEGKRRKKEESETEKSESIKKN